mgnify:FL=1
MKSLRTIQTKRTRPKSGFRMLHAATRATKKRKQRAATTAAPEDLGEVPGVGVARALVVILLLHVAAIAGIWLHNRWSEGADIQAAKPALAAPIPPERRAELRPHTVSKDDNIDKISRKYGVDRAALVTANDGVEDYEPGWVINIPNRRSEEISPSDAMGDRVNPAAPEQAYGQTPRPLIQTSETQSYPGSQPGELVPVEGVSPEPKPTDEPILVRGRPPVGSARPGPAPVSSNRRHTVKPNETLWRIALNNGISVDELKRANPNVNVSALKIGATLIIPEKR